VILRSIALPISEGYSHAEVAAMLGKNESWVSARMRDLRKEIRRLQSEGAV